MYVGFAWKKQVLKAPIAGVDAVRLRCGLTLTLTLTHMSVVVQYSLFLAARSTLGAVKSTHRFVQIGQSLLESCNRSRVCVPTSLSNRPVLQQRRQGNRIEGRVLRLRVWSMRRSRMLHGGREPRSWRRRVLRGQRSTGQPTVWRSPLRHQRYVCDWVSWEPVPQGFAISRQWFLASGRGSPRRVSGHSLHSVRGSALAHVVHNGLFFHRIRTLP